MCVTWSCVMPHLIYHPEKWRIMPGGKRDGETFYDSTMAHLRKYTAERKRDVFAAKLELWALKVKLWEKVLKFIV